MSEYQPVDLNDHEQSVIEVYDQELDAPKPWSSLERVEKVKRAGVYAASTLAAAGTYYLGVKIGFIDPHGLQP